MITTDKIYRPGDHANGYFLGEDGIWHPEIKEQVAAWKWLAAIFGSMAVLGGMVAIQVGMADDNTVTIHELAVNIAEQCYDDESSSDGTAEPGTRAFDRCLENVTFLGDYLRANDYEVVDGNGDPVAYSSVPREVEQDIDSWLTENWKP